MNDAPTRICTKCNTELPLTNLYFHKRKNYKYGMDNVCKKCRAQESLKRFSNSKEARNIYCKFHLYNKSNLLSTLTLSDWEEIKAKFNYECAYCGRKLPLTQDHFIPVSKGGEYTKNNIVPSCQSCNSSKKNKNFFRWYIGYEYYSEHREKAILEHLDIDINNSENKQVRNATKLYLEKKEYIKMVQVRLEVSLIKEMKYLCIDNDLNVTEYIEMLIKKDIEERKKATNPSN